MHKTSTGTARAAASGGYLKYSRIFFREGGQDSKQPLLPRQTRRGERALTLQPRVFKQFFDVIKGEKALRHDWALKQLGFC